MKYYFGIILLYLIASIINSCKNGNQGTEQVAQISTINVATVSILQGDIQQNIRLNGKIIYLKKTAVVSPISGYILKISANYGDLVQKNSILFEIQTKENKALENMNVSLAKTGIIEVLAPSNGIISEMNMNQTGMYIAEGAVLCTITESNNFLAQVNVPFEFNQLIEMAKTCKVFLPDESIINGEVVRILPTINESSQTQNVLIKLNTDRRLPENLNLQVQFVGSTHKESFLVPREALLTNETQSEFWLMKMVHDSLAVRVVVKKGLENDSLIEVTSSELSSKDIVITEGAYGLGDSIVVNIVK